MSTTAPSAALPSRHPLIARMIKSLGCVEVDESGIDAFTASAADAILFFSGDPKLFPESLDVAVVLPELLRAYPGRFTVGVVDRQAQKALQVRYGVARLPALVFLRDGAYVGVIAGMQDWHVYREKIATLLNTPPGPVPAIMGKAGGSMAHRTAN